MPLRADTAVGTVTDMRSTSAMREKPKYRSSYGSRYTGSFRNSVPAYTPRPLGTTSSSATRTYGGGGYGGAYYMERQRNSIPNSEYSGVSGYGSIAIVRNTDRSGETQTLSEITGAEPTISAGRHRLFAPPSGGKEAQWASWWSTFASIYGEDATEDDLETWWYSIYGASAAPDDYGDFYNWCITNRKFATLPVGDGVAFMLLLALVLIMYKRNSEKTTIIGKTKCTTFLNEMYKFL